MNNPLKSKRIAITGFEEPTGAEIVRRLLPTGAHIRLVVREEEALAPPSRELEVVACELTNPVELREAFEGIDTVFHCAVQHTGDEVVRTNTDAAHHVVNACLDAGVGRLVYLGSSVVLGEPNAQGVFDANCYPDSISGWDDYTLSRFYAENEVWRGVCYGLRATIVNPSPNADPHRTAEEMIRLSTAENAVNKRLIVR